MQSTAHLHQLSNKVELAQRSNDGVTVTLYADTVTKETAVHVEDSRNGEDFTISEIPPFRALDVYYHPYAYADRLLTTGNLVAV